jgi:ATP-dependent DNA ligase
MQISPDMSKWLIRVLDRHLNFGISIKSINSVWDGLVSTFECQLAEKFEPELVADIEYIAIEPKLDGTRIIAIVRGGNTTLYTRNGKIITNFDSTIANELALLCGDRNMVFDGELMSSDFSATMGQLFRKQNNNIKDTFYHAFDVMTYNEWVQRDCKLTCQQSHELLEDLAIDINCKFVKTVERHIIRPSQITEFHKKFRDQGYEGSMIKLLDEHYMWKRDTNVMKLKDWYDFDLTIDSFVEGTGRYLGHLGSFVVKYEGKSVKVERGLLTKEQAKEVWENRSHYRGKYIEVQAQEVTKDGSLRFPKFIRFRPDKD